MEIVSKFYLLTSLILQTLQQLIDVYGDSVDKVIQGNTSNIIYLKSTDDSMIETLSKMSGETHRANINQKTVSRDVEAMAGNLTANEGKISYNMSTEKVPVISTNDLAFIGERNSIVFRAGDSPVWNKNELALPMSWRLFQNQIKVPGRDFTLQTVPTLSQAMDFDVRKNQPDFFEMLNVRMKQCTYVDDCKENYKQLFSFTDEQVAKLDLDVYAQDIMDLVGQIINVEGTIKKEMSEKTKSGDEPEDVDVDYNADADDDNPFSPDDLIDNTEVAEERMKYEREEEYMSRPIYAGRRLSKRDLISPVGVVNHQFDVIFAQAYNESRGKMEHDNSFTPVPNPNTGFMDLYDSSGSVLYVRKYSAHDVDKISDAAETPNNRVYGENKIDEKTANSFSSYEITDAFYQYLAKLDAWTFAQGEFEHAVEDIMRRKEMQNSD